MPQLGSVSERRLNAARLTGANTVAAFAQIAVDMPEGYFGAADTMTAWGAGFLGWLAVATGVSLWGLWNNREWAAVWMWLCLSVNIGAFVAPLVVSPVIPALVIIWSLAMLAWMLFPTQASSAYLRERAARFDPDEEWLDRWLRRSGPAVRHLLGISLLLNIAVFGYRLSEEPVAFGLTLVLALATLVLSAGPLWQMLQKGRWVVAFLLTPLAMMAFFLGAPEVLLLLISLFQLSTLLIFLMRAPIFDDILDYFYAYPALLVLVTFASLTLLGTLLLSLPAASATGEPVAALDALFTATSASCITGLIVLDTPTDYSLFGHVVILILFQLGGMGILVLSTFATLLLGSKLGLRAEQAVEETLGMRGAESTYRLAKFVVGSTLLIEAVGAILLTFAFLRLEYPLGSAIWHGVFHAVSAFCHAGFALHSESMMIFEDDPFALTTITVLIVLGSIGFLALAMAWQWTRTRRRVDVQFKIIVITSGILLVMGFVLFLLCEWNASMAGMTLSERFFNALFQSATLRSAGFNSVDTGLFTDATLWFSICFMVIGGAPGSTAGGIKVTTLIILILAVRGIAAGRPRVVVFNRELSQSVVYRSAGIVILYLLIFFVLFFLLLLTQPLPFEMLAFEAASALGTVGISAGATPHLNAVGKALIIAVIFIGRVGPLALALVLGRGKPSRLRYPEARVMVG